MKGKISIDLDSGTVSATEAETTVTFPLDSPEAFALVSKAWLRCGWDTKYVYSFAWLGRPLLQLPEDLLRIQEVVYRIKPDVILETGIAHGGSLVFYASLCKAMGRGRVIGIDIDIRAHNKEAIIAHELFPYIKMIEGDSTEEDTVKEVRSLIKAGEKVIVLLDSSHARKHVLAELNAYGPLVSVGSYIVAMDGIMSQLDGAPRTSPDWSWNNPRQAAKEFVATNTDFAIEEPAFTFNEGLVNSRVTYWPDAFIKRLR